MVVVIHTHEHSQRTGINAKDGDSPRCSFANHDDDDDDADDDDGGGVKLIPLADSIIRLLQFPPSHRCPIRHHCHMTGDENLPNLLFFTSNTRDISNLPFG